jgi:hypothetical protein
MELTRLLGYCGGSFGIGFVSGLLPAVNTEAYLLTLAALARSPKGASPTSDDGSDRCREAPRPWCSRARSRVFLRSTS